LRFKILAIAYIIIAVTLNLIFNNLLTFCLAVLAFILVIVLVWPSKKDDK
jgi:hypothetical protein